MLSESWRLVFTPKELRKKIIERSTYQLVLYDAQGSQVKRNMLITVHHVYKKAPLVPELEWYMLCRKCLTM